MFIYYMHYVVLRQRTLDMSNYEYFLYYSPVTKG